ncbi:hypothetical protein SAMN04489712_12757 [Thermomonospora echinospora]|uniref:Uncharacterized protein n=1 Tax=Thermomonospora echinospora TaxID=1992 RepID=A0A1H6E061_9ACTN|nr:hypothetical protein [Thermomonospora echinospora]SEG90851.1 hypothetical protein SAMN04489712_12757 [Thermomonospora echinospora]
MSTSGSRGMSNGARHGLGAVVGLVLTPVIGWLLMFGVDRLYRSMRVFRAEGADRWLGVAALVLAAVLLGLLVGSRLSPLASLIPGVVLTAVGLPWLFAAEWSFRTLRDLLPGRYYILYANLGSLGLWILVGCVLLAASFPPSRWRGAASAGPSRQSQYAPPPGGQWPPSSHQVPGQVPGQGPGDAPARQPSGVAGPPPFDPNARPYAPPPPWSAPGGEAVPGQPGQPGQPGPAVPQPPSPGSSAQHGSPPQGPGTPPQEFGGPPQAAGPSPQGQGPGRPQEGDGDEPGEWTRMYGGKDPRDDRPQS